MHHGIMKLLCVYPAVALALSLVSAPAGAEKHSLAMPLASQSLVLDIAVSGERLLAVGQRGHILLSDDRGESWNQARVPTRQMLTAVYFPSALRGWAVGHDGLVLATVDGGDNWVVQRDGLVDQLQINRERLQQLERESEQLEARFEGGGSGAQRVELELMLEDLEMDIEDAHFMLDEPINAPPLLDVYFSDELRGVAVGAFNTLLLTDDGGVSWHHVSARLDNPDEYHLNAVTGDGEGALWLAGEGGLLFHSDNYGVDWESLQSPYPGSWFGIARAPESGRLLVFGLRGNAFYSQDDGERWQAVALQTDRSLAGGWFITDRYVLLVGAVGTLMLSEDGGESFHRRVLKDRRNLSAGACAGEQIVLAGQGGLRLVAGFGGANE
jgi:photosystem II stability/assembly factor-like uncharacterized protein